MARKSGSRTGKKSTVRPSSQMSKTQGSKSRSSSRSGASARSSENRKVLTMPRRHEAEASSSHGGRSRQTRVLIDQDQILEWAEERGARPAHVRGTGGQSDVGMIRLEFSGFGSEQSLEEIEWDDWFSKFVENGLALLVQDETAGGQKSNFNKLVKRETAEGKKSSSRSARRRRGAA